MPVKEAGEGEMKRQEGLSRLQQTGKTRGQYYFLSRTVDQEIQYDHIKGKEYSRKKKATQERGFV